MATICVLNVEYVDSTDKQQYIQTRFEKKETP